MSPPTAAGPGGRRSPRHPSGRFVGAHLAGPAAQVGARFLGVVGPHPEVGLALQAVRGAQGRSRAEFARAYGLSVEELGDVESGAVALERVPVPLRVLTPLVALVGTLARAPGIVGTRGTDGPGTVAGHAAKRS